MPLRLLIFFPSITFGMLSSEIFPWAFLCTIIFYFRKFINDIFVLTCILFFPILLGLFSDIPLLRLITSYASYLNALSGFLIMLYSTKEDINNFFKLAKLAFGIQVIVSLIQILSPFELNFLQSIVPRVSTEIDLRGVSGLSAEPARQAIVLNLIFSVIIAYQHIFKGIDVKFIFFTLLFFLFLMFVNRSFTGLLFFLINLITILFLTRKIFLGFLFALGIISILPFFYFQLSLYADESRVFQIINLLINSDSQLVVQAILFSSGFRIATFLAVWSEFRFFGSGIGNWTEALNNSFSNNIFLNEFVSNSAYNRIIFDSVRPSSITSSLYLEGGLISVILIFAFLILKATKRFKGIVFKLDNIMMIILPIFSIVFLGNIGSPIQWICLGIILNLIFYNQSLLGQK